MHKRPETLSELMAYTMRAPRIEPVERVKDIDRRLRGARNAPVAPRYIWHKYPIKGGITGYAVMAEAMIGSNALLKHLMQRNEGQ